VNKVGMTAMGVAIVAITAMFAAPVSVLAHARLKSSTPAVGEVLSASPTAVSITFSEDVQKVAGTYDIRVTSGSGEVVTAAASAIADGDRTTMSVALKPLAPGRYEVHWKNVSDADGDPLEGAFSFYLSTRPTDADLAADVKLAAIGAPETPVTSATNGTASPTASGRPATTPATAPATTPTATAISTGGSGGSSNSAAIVIAVAIVAVLVAGGCGFVYVRSRNH
jgi:methionine-rich copper-binding protein CopC